ncbi:MAG TPA: acyl carrier protein [Candidatus Limiplasma sp.]|jgi:acyl carrier protein|nr:acyl carrier protein [Candidatus Limiplasma sp.]HPR77470.1 acyl carrier protein [Candidatus Limiplasma sp.]
MTTFETIAKLVAESKDLDVNSIKPEMTFADLGLDSLDVAELVMNMEDELGVTIEISPALKTVQDVVALVDAQKK